MVPSNFCSYGFVACPPHPYSRAADSLKRCALASATGANILRDIGGNVKLGDFGTSKRLETITSTPEQVRRRTVCGTWHYVSPEMLRGDGYTFETDIW